MHRFWLWVAAGLLFAGAATLVDPTFALPVQAATEDGGATPTAGLPWRPASEADLDADEVEAIDRFDCRDLEPTIAGEGTFAGTGGDDVIFGSDGDDACERGTGDSVIRCERAGGTGSG